MKLTQYLHFPQGNDSYTVAENIGKYYSQESVIWAIGDSTSGIYNDGSFPVIFSHPKSNGVRLFDIQEDAYMTYCTTVDNALATETSTGINLVHHGLVIAKCLAEKYPVISYLHGTEMPAHDDLPPFVRKDLHESIIRSVKVLAMSELQQDMAIKIFGDSIQDKLEILHCGIDTSLFHPRDNYNDIVNTYGLHPDKKILLYAGRLTYEKNLELAIDAFDESLATEAQMVLVGSGNQFEILQKRAEGKDVTFIPAVPQAELAQIMSASDLFVLTSRYESFGLVILEAIASGAPVVATARGVMPILVSPGKGGYTFERDDDNHDKTVIQVREAMHQALILDKQVFAEYSAYVRESYSWESIVQKFEHIVRNI